MTDQLTNTLNKIGERLKEKAAKKLMAEKQSEDLPETRKRLSGKSGHTIKRDAEKTLKEYADRVGIEQYDLFPGNEYPTYFTRLPLFPPLKRSTARNNQAEITRTKDFVKLTSRWDQGGVYKSGPALTTEDEDTLIGILQLRSLGFKGNENLMPGKNINHSIHQISGKEIKVHATYCVISDLESFIKGKAPPKKGWGGATIKRRRESIERLAAQVLKFTKIKGHDDYVGKEFSLMEIDWVGDKRDACYYISLHPMMVSWLEGYRTYIDLNIRRELTPFGKALHRFLSSQISKSSWTKDFEVILEAIGFKGRMNDAKKYTIAEIEKMKKLGFPMNVSISGNGRSDPFKLSASPILKELNE